MAWSNGPFRVYHGTVRPHANAILRDGIDLAKCRDKSDFGKGFYVTRIREHAIAHANVRYEELLDTHDEAQRTFNVALDPECAAVIEFTVIRAAIAQLETLAFVQPTDEWLDFVRYCRLPNYAHKPPGGEYYAAVYGPMYLDGADAAIPGREQISFHTVSATAVLTRGSLIMQGSPKI